MDGEDSLVRWDIDQDMESPTEQFQYRTSCQSPDNAEDHCKDHDAVTAVIELPDELKVLRAVCLGHQRASGSGRVPPDSYDGWNGKAEDVGKNSPERCPSQVELPAKSPARTRCNGGRPKCVTKNVHRAASTAPALILSA